MEWVQRQTLRNLSIRLHRDHLRLAIHGVDVQNHDQTDIYRQTDKTDSNGSYPTVEIVMTDHHTASPRPLIRPWPSPSGWYPSYRAKKWMMNKLVVRIGSIIIFHLSKLWKATVCGVIFLVRVRAKFEVDHSWERQGHTSTWDKVF